MTTHARREAIPKKFKKKDPRDMDFKAFILPQYHELCQYNFLNNNLPQKCTAQQCKQKIKEINAMIKSSEGHIKQVEQANDEQSQLKNQQTMTWLAKRYTEHGNRKYFGDNEDEFQQKFLRIIFETIWKHLQTNKQIPIQEFHKLLAEYQLPMSFQTLSMIYDFVDANKDGQLNLSEFYSFNKNEQANHVYLDQFKQEGSSNTFASSPFKPTSLSALCIFVSFRINHDFLTDFLYDANFQVKDKSLGLLNMLDIVKLQGQMRIKNDNDKRIMRQFNVEKSSILGFNVPATFRKKQPTKLNQDELDIKTTTILPQTMHNIEQDSHTNLEVKYVRRASLTTDTPSQQQTYSSLEALGQRQNYQQSNTSLVLNHFGTTLYSPRTQGPSSQASTDRSIHKPKLFFSRNVNTNTDRSEYFTEDQISNLGKKSSLERTCDKIESKRNVSKEFENKFRILLDSANKKGEIIAQRTYDSNQESIREIRDMEVQKINSSRNISENSFSQRNLSHGLILPALLEQQQQIQPLTPSRDISQDILSKYKVNCNNNTYRSFNNCKKYFQVFFSKQPYFMLIFLELHRDKDSNSKMKNNLSSSNIQPQKNLSGYQNQGNSFSRNTKCLMEHTLIESENSYQVMMGRKLMKQDEKEDNKEEYSPRKKCKIIVPTTKQFNYQQIKHILSPIGTPCRQPINSIAP